MSKPIFIVKLPSIHTPEFSDGISYKLKKDLSDYHVIVVSMEIEDVSFECYNTTDLDNKSFEELKELFK